MRLFWIGTSPAIQLLWARGSSSLERVHRIIHTAARCRLLHRASTLLILQASIWTVLQRRLWSYGPVRGIFQGLGFVCILLALEKECHRAIRGGQLPMLCQCAAESADVLLERSYLLRAIETMAGREVVRGEVSQRMRRVWVGLERREAGGEPSIGRAQRPRRNWHTGGCDFLAAVEEQEQERAMGRFERLAGKRDDDDVKLMAGNCGL